MRRLSVFAFVLSLLMPGLAVAGSVEVVPYGGFQFGGGFDVEQGSLDIKEAVNFGVGVDIKVAYRSHVGFLWNRQQTELRLRPDEIFGPRESLFDLAVDSFHGGGSYEFADGALKPFIAVTLGATRLAPDVEELSSEWYFSTSFGGGVKYFFNRSLGVRLQGRVWPIWLGSGGEVFCGFPPGNCYVRSVGDSMVQGEFSAGLILAF